MSLLRRLSSSSATHMVVAFLAMGGWAVFANRDHAMPRPLIAGVVQGALSALITLFLKSVIERLAALFDGTASLWAPPLIAIAASSTLLVLIHLLAGTPEIARTVALPLLVSSTYAAAYNYTLYLREHRTP
ncbi:hypothetical protein IB238_07460 [Rhizobium sp. ARZ01]|uniref:hypothetical protein n=1 Tax=Rhizobium sp. ARZ01 TaxID=2769313 RepID=UPI00177BEFFD|nr:hypothetical protein [Rhizobium sp. ARZ01]MBD9372455.1 hypothetical protein [Rhizobium sp. ARZ01]